MSREGDIIGGRFQLGGLVAIQGLEGCTDRRCTKINGRCAGYHCAVCLKPSGMTGHAACRDEASLKNQQRR